MYRIELSPGEETAFRSIEELAVAIRRGVVTPRARIYHNATNKWLPIQFHPHYKQAVEMPLSQAALVAGPPVKALSALSPLALAHPEPEPRRQVAPPPEEPPPPKRSRKRKKPRRSLRLALLGALLIAGAHLALSGEPSGDTESSPKPRSHRRLVIGPSGQVKSEISSSVAAMVSELPTGSAAAASQILANKATSRLGATTRKPAVPARETHPSAPTARQASAASVTIAAPEPEPSDTIEPPPSAIDISVPTIAGAESLTPKMVDSSGTRSLKRILRAIDGSPAQENSKPKH